VVRHRFLIPTCKGSNPFTPILKILVMSHFLNLNYITYSTLLIAVLLALAISTIVLVLSYLVATQTPDPEKTSAYECGFEPFEDARNRFDVRFYIVAILFIIFDLEVAFLFP
jgi:NADH:ubiquinone oxidoreductase subunit 3 (subunit A)